ncbi:class I SAM-dependent methyltransferase [Corallococcus exiguus]|uniref:class I SAM-dependent methyltransferase n=1 Tax=Corallococcus exiguus TaxID=83462 RepID=UPI001494DC53|nr:class I SAM-dependent methyltransferase [Corallococcus exiguus]NPC75265.1 class I SAM-dependent methyltransferase [Corallococcus exiguus]
MAPSKELHEANRRSWNEATPAHNSHKGDQARALREGHCTLFPEERELVGDVRDRSLVHLLCNSGQDTLSFAAKGARVTGVDISDEAIAFARSLSEASGLPGTFVRQDVYDWLAAASAEGTRYDVAFSSYGAMCWLSDLGAWARGLAGVLAPGGRFVVVDFHPLALTLDEQWRLHYPYGGGVHVETSGVTDYVAQAQEALVPWGFKKGVKDFRNPHPDHTFQWGLGEIITALLSAGLRLEALREYPYANGARLFPRMRETEGRRMWPPEELPTLPLMFGLVVSKPA